MQPLKKYNLVGMGKLLKTFRQKDDDLATAESKPIAR